MGFDVFLPQLKQWASYSPCREAITKKYDELAHGTIAMADWILLSYYQTDIMPLFVSKDIITKLEDNRYTDEEVELLYLTLTQKYDRM